MGVLTSKVAEKQGQVVPSGVSDGGALFIDGQKHSMEKKKKRFFMMTSMDSSRRMLLACIRQSITLLQGERVSLDEMEHDAEQGQSRQEVEGEGQMGNENDRKMRGKKGRGISERERNGRRRRTEKEGREERRGKSRQEDRRQRT